MKKSATAMAAVKTVEFALANSGVPTVPVKNAEGTLTRAGDAKGKVQVQLLGLQELEFVLVGDGVYLKGVTGGFTKTYTRAQLAAIYDPSKIITGVPQLLSSATNAQVKGEEDGHYTVTVTLDAATLKTIVPGVTAAVNGTLWIDTATSRLLRADLPLTGGTVTVTLSDYDAPVTITPPPTG